MNILEETRFLMKENKITANKSLGQNFLINEQIIIDTIKSDKISKNDLVIEIGPGLGTLTNELAKNAGKVICIELDEKMVKILNNRFSLFDNIQIINEDILKIDIDKLIEQNKMESTKIVANLPYYITTPIIMKLLESRANVDTITVMVQKEVATRLCAKTGTRDAGAITYAVEYYAKAREDFFVSRTSFIPVPNVDSEVITLELRKDKNKKVENEEKLFKIIKYSFMQRRKTLVNALQNTDLYNSKEEIKEILKKLNIDEKIRGEALTLNDFINIANLK